MPAPPAAPAAPADLSVSVVMPAHNEEELLAKAVHQVVEGLRAWGVDHEVIVVENGSTDATPDVAWDLAEELPEVRALTHPEADYGRSLRTGFLAATRPVVVNFDVDYVDLDFLARAAGRIAGGRADVVVGSKRGDGSRDDRNLSRRTVTLIFSSVLRLGFGLKVSDTHGMKALHRAPLLRLVERCRFGTDLFDTELVLRAERAGLRVSEVGVTVEELRPSRTPIARRIPRTLGGLIRLRLALWRER